MMFVLPTDIRTHDYVSCVVSQINTGESNFLDRFKILNILLCVFITTIDETESSLRT